MQTKRLNILGSTGSIGTQALEICRHLNIKVCGISAGSNIALLEEQIRDFHPLFCHVYDEEKGRDLALKVRDTDTKVLYGKDTLCAFALSGDPDTLLTSVVGSVGLFPTVKAIENGMKIALANKETLVAAGKLVMEKAKKHHVPIVPVDSEHSAVFQALQGNDRKNLKRILLTASGGPFFGKSLEELRNVTRKDALNHPNWSMGAKITIDSATLMNKGFEVIEARWLFDTSAIDVVVHPQSIIHSMVEYQDHSVIAQLGVPSMKIPIQYALTYPERLSCPVESPDFFEIANLSFFKPDTKTFRLLQLAYDALTADGTAPMVLNGANEMTVQAFLEDKIRFTDIADINEEVLKRHKPKSEYTLDDFIEYDNWAREEALSLINEVIH